MGKPKGREIVFQSSFEFPKGDIETAVQPPQVRSAEVQAVVDRAQKAGDRCQSATIEVRRWWEN